MEPNDIKPRCRQCPGSHFEIVRIRQSRYMAICHALELVMKPNFPDNKISESQNITKANIASVTFKPFDHCPFIERLRAEGKIPWASYSIDFSK